MAFSCTKNGEVIYSFEYELSGWIALKESKDSIFSMNCCGAKAILKTSKLGTQFFAHKTKPKNLDCSTGGETAEHIHIKYLVSKKLFECGWRVEVEKRGVSSNGDVWIADIYAEKGKAKIVIEVQWSRQSFIETKRRQQVYKDSGIRCAWLLRSGSISDRNAVIGDYLHRTRDIPIFSIYRNTKRTDSTYKIYNVNKERVESSISFDPLEPIELDLDSFIEMLVSAKIKFRPKLTPYSELMVNITEQSCWRCHKSTNTVVSVVYENTVYGITHEGSNIRKYIDECDKETVDIINMNFSKPYNFAPIRRRYSKTESSSYIANSCIHCDSLMGRFFDRQAYREAYYSGMLIETERLTVNRYEEDVGHTKKSNQKQINYDVGAWLVTEPMGESKT